MKRKALALVLSFAVLTTVCVPGTFAAAIEEQPESELVCGLTEHTHDESCYTAEKKPICGQEAVPAHAHVATCYDWKSVPTCGLPEDENHTHGDDCYSVEKELICTLEETDGHTHTDECYEQVEVLSCGLAEHTHTDECYAPVETEQPAESEPDETVEPTAEPTSEPSEEPVVSPEPTTEPSEEPTTEPAEPPLPTEEPGCTCGSEDGTHAEDCPLSVSVDEPEFPDDAFRIAKGDAILEIERNPGESVTFAFVDMTPIFVLCQSGSGPWTSWKAARDVIAIGESVVTWTVPDDAAAGDEFKIGISGDAADHEFIDIRTVAIITVTGEAEGSEVTGETESGTKVTVSGDLPEGAALNLADVTIDDIISAIGENEANADVVAALENLAADPRKCLGFDISLLQGDTEVQPNSPVTVTLSAPDFLSSGREYIAYHIHEEGDGTYSLELLGPSDAANGAVSFEMSGFSYVLVFEGDVDYYILDDVDAFYTVSGVASINDHWQFLGLYYSSTGDLHFLLAPADKTPFFVNDQLEDIVVGDQTYMVDTVNHTVNGNKYDLIDTVFTQLNLYKAKEVNGVPVPEPEGNPLKTVKVMAKKGISLGFYDFNMGPLDISQEFNFGVNTTTGKGWQISGTVDVKISYTLEKNVALGATVDKNTAFKKEIEVQPGDTIIYRITVKTGDTPLHGMSITDLLPNNVFLNNVEMSIDDPETGALGDWQPFSETLFGSYDSTSGEVRNLYIKATVDPGLAIAAKQTHVNTVLMEGMNLPDTTDTATIVVKPLPPGKLTIKKFVASDNPMDQADPDAEFSFSVVVGNDGEIGTEYTFKLKNEESYEISVNAGEHFTITETPVTGYTTTINGPDGSVDGTVYTGDMSSGAASVVTFINHFSTRNTTLSITKTVEKAYANDTLPDDDSFVFEVTITGEGVPASYTYTVNNGGTDGTVANGGTISLQAGQTATISGIPVGATYTVTEILGGLAADYELTSVVLDDTTNVTNGTRGTFSVGGAALVFTNTYKRHLADLTITKTGCEAIDENQSFIFRVQGNDDANRGIDLRVVIQGDGSKTIRDLPLGSYIVTEETGWSWRYEPKGGEEKTAELEAESYAATVPFVNDRQTEADHLPENTDWKWLNGADYKRNWFGEVPDTDDNND